MENISINNANFENNDQSEKNVQNMNQGIEVMGNQENFDDNQDNSSGSGDEDGKMIFYYYYKKSKTIFNSFLLNSFRKFSITS